MSKETTYSIIIPVYNSEKIVSETVKKTIEVLNNINYEIILINDGSSDNSWGVISNLASKKNNIIAIDLLKNYGQHTALFCGINHAKGDFLVTMDDDLQNPPVEIFKLIEKIEEGYDLVFGKFTSKKHKTYRKIGTKIINYLNSKIFNKPDNITLSNFRIFSKEVADRVKTHNTFYPYIPGLLLMFSNSIGNVETAHHKREIGESNYSLWKILKLTARLLFNYSSYPLKTLTFTGILISLISFALGMFFVVRGYFYEVKVPGWTSLAVLLSFFNGFLILLIGVIGEYLSRILNQISFQKAYQIREITD